MINGKNQRLVEVCLSKEMSGWFIVRLRRDEPSVEWGGNEIKRGTAEMIDWKRVIQGSPLRFKLKSMGLDIFQEWSIRAAHKHHLSVQKIRTGVQAEQIESDILDHLTEGLEVLFEERYSHKPMSWRYGFLCGYVRAKLTTGWHKRYLSLNSKQYEDLVKLAAMREFFEQDPESVSAVQSIYRYRLAGMDEPEDGELALEPISSRGGGDELDAENDRASGEDMSRAGVSDEDLSGVIPFPVSRAPGTRDCKEGFGEELRVMLKDIIQEKLDLIFDREYGPSIDLCPPLDAHLPEPDICGILQQLDVGIPARAENR